ncbi:MAG: hypothetical protein HFG18_11880 [Oscillospiraceae bacterium]|nr:hypothetical protein [Oscillospiraceae bacterium]MCI9364557.1 hypothetical protein [Oscillospiraceae bacterium]MCI9669068.1 hypothetical protein [Oscillospiraceae bacterium]RKJ56149.1 hypothetical protein D7X25_06640 [bacterium 1XD42-8]RKJ66411.1 hypothetical protein D7Y09_03735 [bacterium 1XD42-1]
MDKYFTAMNEKLRRKYYPRGYFAAAQKYFKSSARFLCVSMGIIGTFCGFLTVFFIYATIKEASKGHSALSGIPYIAVPLGLMIFCIIMIVASVRRHNTNVQQLMEQYAEKNGLTVADMRAFDEQSGASDTFQVRLAGKKKVVVDDVGMGLLTRDYLVFMDTVMKRKEISSVCFYDHLLVYPTKHGQEIVHVLCIGIVSQRGIQLHSEVKREAGEKLMELLRQSNPDIKTWDGEVLKEEEFQALCPQKAKKQGRAIP